MSKKLKKSPDYSDFFNNLIGICEDRGTSPTALAEKFAAKSVLTAWKHGKIDVDIVSKLSLELNVSIEQLILGKENSLSIRLSKDEQELVDYYNKLPPTEKIKLVARAEAIADVYKEQVEAAEQEEPTIEIRHSYYKVSAGTGYNLDAYNQWDTIEVPDTPEANKADFALTISGDSMEPVYYNGDIVLVKSQSAVDNGEIGIFIVEDNGYIKKYGGDRLISLNAAYDDIMFSDYNPEDIRCMGLVIGRV